MTTNKDLRQRFEEYIIALAIKENYRYKETMLIKNDFDGSYTQSWVDMQWQGYQAGYTAQQKELEALHKTIKTLTDSLDSKADSNHALLEEREILKKDAVRYRWLIENGRSNSKRGSTAIGKSDNPLKASFSFRYWVDDIDSAIDQAMKENNANIK